MKKTMSWSGLKSSGIIEPIRKQSRNKMVSYAPADELCQRAAGLYSCKPVNIYFRENGINEESDGKMCPFRHYWRNRRI